MRKINGYGWFTAEYCRSTGLPMYDKKSYAVVADQYLSKTRCKKIKKPVQEGEEPVAFYRVDRGYCGLYLREKDGEENEAAAMEFHPCTECRLFVPCESWKQNYHAQTREPCEEFERGTRRPIK